MCKACQKKTTLVTFTVQEDKEDESDLTEDSSLTASEVISDTEEDASAEPEYAISKREQPYTLKE